MSPTSSMIQIICKYSLLCFELVILLHFPLCGLTVPSILPQSSKEKAHPPIYQQIMFEGPTPSPLRNDHAVITAMLQLSS